MTKAELQQLFRQSQADYKSLFYKYQELEAEAKRLQSLAVSTSSDGTSFYYKDAWEADQKRIAELKERLHFNIDLGFDLEHYNVSKD